LATLSKVNQPGHRRTFAQAQSLMDRMLFRKTERAPSTSQKPRTKLVCQHACTEFKPSLKNIQQSLRRVPLLWPSPCFQAPMRMRELLLWLDWVVPVVKFRFQSSARWMFGRPNAKLKDLAPWP
jgi:hypothetical protein